MRMPSSAKPHRVRAVDPDSVIRGRVRYSPSKSLWFSTMAVAALVGGTITFTWAALTVYVVITAALLLLGHSLGSHRKLIHDSYQCPKWLEYFLVYCGVQVGLAGPLGLLHQHELRDFAQRQRDCHAYLRHGSAFWRDGWWQLHCELRLDDAPALVLEPRIADDAFYAFLERTWMAQQLLPALVLYVLGGWAFVFWGVCARVASGVLGHWLIGYFAHNQGSRHWEVRDAAVQGQNIRFTSLLTMGESWHNNHHAFPGSARLGLFAGEWDPGWWVLAALHKVGLVWSIRLPQDLPTRAELYATDAPGAAALRQTHRDASDARDARTRLRDVWALCVAAESPSSSDPPYTLKGPGAFLSAAMARRLIRSQDAFAHDPMAYRMTIDIHSRSVRGLPALCIAVARRNVFCVCLALLVAPLAVAFETLRESFDVA